MFLYKPKSFFVITTLLLLLTTSGWSATIIVDRANDSGNGFCTLRQAVLSANFNLALAGCAAGEDNVVDEIYIDVPGPITLTQGEIPVFGAVNIDIVSGSLVRIIAAPDSRIFNVNSPDANDNDFYLWNLSLTDGDVDTENGGAILIRDAGEVGIFNSWFLNNSAENGGAIYGNDSKVDELKIQGSHFINNGATTGGALYGQNLVDTGPITFNYSVFKDNFAQSGGAIYLRESGENISFLNNKFTGNIASDSGAGVYLRGLNGVTIYNMNTNLFYNNQAVDSGGAIRLFTNLTRLNLINSTFSHNYADYGGAISNGSGNLQVSTSTFVYNFAQTAGANLHSTSQGINTVGHSIVAHPISKTNCNSPNVTFSSLGANVSDDASCGFNEPSDTLGDPYLTGPVVLQGIQDQDRFGYYPTVYSPALDNSHQVFGICLDSSSSTILLDQFGKPRDLDGDGDGTGECDAGAIEAYPNTDLLFYDGFGVAD